MNKLQPEHIRRAWANSYAQIQILKLKILIACFAVAVIVHCTGCTDSSKAKKVLRSQGFTQIELTGYRWLGCSKDDAFHTGFTARSVNGQEVSGVVCSGFLKSATVRFD